jgi:hypothetical protein
MREIRAEKPQPERRDGFEERLREEVDAVADVWRARKDHKKELVSSY